MSTLKERVAAGAAWLDSVEPGWRDAISLGSLNMVECDRCVCGQVFAAAANAERFNREIEWVTYGYGHALRKAGFQHITPEAAQRWAFARGFVATTRLEALTRAQINGRYKRLGAEWRRQIHAKREAERALVARTPELACV